MIKSLTAEIKNLKEENEKTIKHFVYELGKNRIIRERLEEDLAKLRRERDELKEKLEGLKSEVVTLKEECQLRWNQLRWDEGEAAISECGNLQMENKQLKEENEKLEDKLDKYEGVIGKPLDADFGEH